MRYLALILILLSGCGGGEEPPVPVVSNSEIVSPIEMLEVRETECYKQTLDFENQYDEKLLAELRAAAAEKTTLMEYLATSHVTTAEFDLEICRRYAQCYEITDDERLTYVVSCINQREQHRNEIADL